MSFWSSYDLLLTPTLAMPPVPVGWEAEPEDPWEQFDRAVAFTPFTAAFNVTGQPAVSLPLYWTDDGLPIGVQLVGPPLGDALLFRVASQLEGRRGRPLTRRKVGRAALARADTKDVRDGDTAPRTPLWAEIYRRRALTQVKAGRR